MHVERERAYYFMTQLNTFCYSLEEKLRYRHIKQTINTNYLIIDFHTI